MNEDQQVRFQCISMWLDFISKQNKNWIPSSMSDLKMTEEIFNYVSTGEMTEDE